MRVLEVRNLKTYIRQKKQFVHAVDGVSIEVEQGETLGIVGESGSGKSMLGLSIMKLLPPGGYIHEGTIQLNGEDITKADEHHMRSIRGRHVGMVFQDPMTSLNPTKKIWIQIAEGYRLHTKATKSEGKARALEVMKQVGIPSPEERLNSYPHQLSGGLRQRVMIAMALACQPDLLIADEPTTALDVTIQAQILDLLDKLRKDLSMSVILVTHDMGVIAGRADRVVVMYAGQIVETAATGELFSNTKHQYTKALLEAIPRLDDDSKKRLYSIPGLPPSLLDPPRGCRFAPRCRFATEICLSTEPKLTDLGNGHSFSCHHPVAESGSNGAVAQAS